MKQQNQNNEPLTYEKVWHLFQETAKRFEETDKKFQETDKKFQEMIKKHEEEFKKWEKKIEKQENAFETKVKRRINTHTDKDCLLLKRQVKAQ
ncbi:MAG: hypothetical protein HY738_00570 [Bacteroidia bacterium]|nr:hypothetical protein [Bacteroidia bacterium]